ncbi:MAG: hypothetical protein J1F68_04755 [Clostridiales bacterium]|nr:hypothetical protein [Clostridiales bacterium]
MKKKYLIWVLLCCIVSIVAVTIGSFVYKANSGEHLSWVFFVFVPLGFTAAVFCLALLGNYMETHKGETIETKMYRSGFSGQKSYIGHHLTAQNKVVVMIDFKTKQFASNQIYRYVVPFSRVASGRIEVLPYNMSNEKCIVQYVIAIARNDGEMSYDYIELFDTVVDKSELGENDKLTEQMFDKYPLLNDILALNEDIQKIVKINQADGVALRQATDEEWQEPTAEDEQTAENHEPNYTKPPFNDKRW